MGNAVLFEEVEHCGDRLIPFQPKQVGRAADREGGHIGKGGPAAHLDAKFGQRGKNLGFVNLHLRSCQLFSIRARPRAAARVRPGERRAHYWRG